ncbi:MAG: hypothetical protein WC497_05995 [Patescibacteria group bacterium]
MAHETLDNPRANQNPQMDADAEARRNLVGLFSVLLKVDRRIKDKARQESAEGEAVC